MNEPQIFVTNIRKGGTGKTTITYNGAFFLATKHQKRVLVIDLDDSANMTSRFIELHQANQNQLSIQLENTVKTLFSDEACQPLTVAKNIDLIAGYSQLTDLRVEVERGRGRQQLRKWYFANREMLGQYDFILIDTHNDFSIFTENALVLADKVLAIADIDSDALTKLQEEEQKVQELALALEEPSTGQTPVNATVLKIGNKVQSNTADSRTFREVFEKLMKTQNSNFIGYFAFRSAFAKTKTTAMPLVFLEAEAKTVGDKKFFQETWKIYEKIFNLEV